MMKALRNAKPISVLVVAATAVGTLAMLGDMRVLAATAVGSVVMLGDMTAVAVMTLAAVATVEAVIAVVVVMVAAGEINFPNFENAHVHLPLDNLATKQLSLGQ
jgi:hypothetical protein